MTEEGHGIEAFRDGAWTAIQTSDIKNGDRFRVYGGFMTTTPKERIADGDAYRNERGNWSVRVRQE